MTKNSLLFLQISKSRHIHLIFYHPNLQLHTLKSSMVSSSSSPSLQEITDAMTEAVDLDGRIKSKFNATVVFNVDGEKYTLHASKTPKDKPDLQVTTSLQTLQDMLDKKISPQQAFMKGKLTIKGKMGLALKLTMVLDATRKHLAVQNARL